MMSQSESDPSIQASKFKIRQINIKPKSKANFPDNNIAISDSNLSNQIKHPIIENQYQLSTEKKPPISISKKIPYQMSSQKTFEEEIYLDRGPMTLNVASRQQIPVLSANE